MYTVIECQRIHTFPRSVFLNCNHACSHQQLQYICSTHFANLCNSEIVLHILEIMKLLNNFKTEQSVCAILELSRNLHSSCSTRDLSSVNLYQTMGTVFHTVNINEEHICNRDSLLWFWALCPSFWVQAGLWDCEVSKKKLHPSLNPNILDVKWRTLNTYSSVLNSNQVCIFTF